MTQVQDKSRGGLLKKLDALPPDRRKRGRLQIDDLDCFQGKTKVGQVVDLSATGCRVVCRGRKVYEPGQELDVVFRCDDIEMAATIRIAWFRRSGFFKASFGARFTSEAKNGQILLDQLVGMGIPMG